jgi:hypothetical protein
MLSVLCPTRFELPEAGLASEQSKSISISKTISMLRCLAADEANSGTDLSRVQPRPVERCDFSLSYSHHWRRQLNRRNKGGLLNEVRIVRSTVPLKGKHPNSYARSSSSSIIIPNDFYVGEAPSVDAGLEVSAAAANANRTRQDHRSTRSRHQSRRLRQGVCQRVNVQPRLRAAARQCRSSSAGLRHVKAGLQSASR